jgi:hypothetical protein
MMEKTFDEEDNSAPKLPDTSMGSSVSTDMENEYNELLRYTMVLPASFEPAAHGPKILENIKGLFSTKNVVAAAKSSGCDEVEKFSYGADCREKAGVTAAATAAESSDDQRLVSSVDNDFEFMKAESIVTNGCLERSIDLINFDQSTSDSPNSKIDPNKGMYSALFTQQHFTFRWISAELD